MLHLALHSEDYLLPNLTFISISAFITLIDSFVPWRPLALLWDLNMWFYGDDNPSIKYVGKSFASKWHLLLGVIKQILIRHPKVSCSC